MGFDTIEINLVFIIFAITSNLVMVTNMAIIGVFLKKSKNTDMKRVYKLN